MPIHRGHSGIGVRRARGNAISHYDCLDFKALASLPVGELAADNCALFLWATDPLLPRAFELILAWALNTRQSGSTGSNSTPQRSTMRTISLASDTGRVPTPNNAY